MRCSMSIVEQESCTAHNRTTSRCGWLAAWHLNDGHSTAYICSNVVCCSRHLQVNTSTQAIHSLCGGSSRRTECELAASSVLTHVYGRQNHRFVNSELGQSRYVWQQPCIHGCRFRKISPELSCPKLPSAYMCQAEHR